MRTYTFILLFALVYLHFSCERQDNPDSGIFLDNVSGYVQKGPYLNGTSVAVSELSQDLTPTGKVFNSQILDNSGTFVIQNLDLVSQYVELKADGFYFNEVSNSNSPAPLTLYALSDLSDYSSLNLNVLSTLERNRVLYLVSQGMDFKEAKQQAQQEILSIFEMSKEGMSESERLDISKQGEDHARLLAISVILQGNLPVSDLSELLANINTDIREDGILNNQSLGSTLLNNAKLIRLESVRRNLENRYENLGMDIVIPDFEKYVKQFTDNTDFVFTSFIRYPASGKYGSNILDKEKINYGSGVYSLKADLPEGASLKVKISGPYWYFPVFQQNTGWEYSDWNDLEKSRVFTSTRTGEIDFQILLGSETTLPSSQIVKISVFENFDTEPSWAKDIVID